MYVPQYSINDKILGQVVEIEKMSAIWKVKIPAYSLKTKFEDQSKAANLFFLAHTLGSDITMHDAEKLLSGRDLGLASDISLLLTNFRNVLEFNHSNVADSYANVDASLLIHLNKIILMNIKDTWEVKFRTSLEELDKTHDDWYEYRDVSIELTAIQEELRGLLDWYRAGTNKVNHLVRSIIFVNRLRQIMPFSSMNKLTILAVYDLVLGRFHYTDILPVGALRVFATHSEDLKEIWKVSSASKDLSLLLEKFLNWLLEDITAAHTEADRQVGEETKTNSQPFLDLNKRQLKILRYLQTIPTVKREDYCQMLDVSTMTAYRDLNDLVVKKLLKLEGQGRGTKYMLASR